VKTTGYLLRLEAVLGEKTVIVFIVST
jgi:hypothetical protein